MSQNSKLPGWGRILLIIIPFLFIVGVFEIIGASILGIELKSLETGVKTSSQKLIISFFSFLGTLVVVWIFVLRVDKERFVDIGLHLKNRAKDIIIGLALGAGIIILGFGILLALGEISLETINWNFKEFLMAMLLFISVALKEEIFCRGYIQKNLMDSFGKYFALVITAFIFSLLHAFNPNINLLGLINIFIAGIFLGISYAYTKNLWLPIALHFSWNFFQSLLGFNVSGQSMYSVLRISRYSPNLFNGGNFGFKGSILASILQIIAILFILFHYSYKRKDSIKIN